jgi:predicted ATPase
MQSWRLLQLEPSALRKQDDFTAPGRLGWDGSHLPSTLYHLAQTAAGNPAKGGFLDNLPLYSHIAAELARLITDVKEVRVDRDEQRHLFTLQVIDQDGTPYSARSLSDGTLRFLALAVLKFDPEAKGVICLEEPENGIHPERIPAMLKLLQHICTDVYEEIGVDNPLRQVIVNTHSPAVVLQVPDDSVLVAELRETVRDGDRFKRAFFSCLPDTWRAEQNGSAPNVVAIGKLLAYLNPAVRDEGESDSYAPGAGEETVTRCRRVMDNPKIQQLLLPLGDTTQ